MQNEGTKRPPGPKHLLGLDFINQFKTTPLPFLMDLRQTYGDAVFARMGPFKSFFFFSPEAIKEILVQRVKELPKLPLHVKILSQWDGNGLLLSEGEFWSRQRRLVQPAFQTRRFEGYVASMVDKTLALSQKWEALNLPVQLDIEKEMTDLTLAIIAKTLFGAELTGNTRELGKAVAMLSEIAVKEMGEIIRYPNWLPIERVRKKKWVIDYLDKTVRGLINERRRNGKDEGDLLSMLLQAVDSEDSKTQMTDEQARDEAMVLFLAGHDTTASALTWFWYVMARYPDIQEKAFLEVSDLLKGNSPRFGDTTKLPYLTSVFKETLRLYPPAIGVFARQATKDIEIAGYPVPKKSIVYVFSYVTHRDPKSFPDPERFDPTRFSPENEKKVSPFIYFPFGVGPRACIGAQFAMTEMTAVAATLLQRFQFSLSPGQGEPELLSHMSLRPKGGIQLTLKKRPSVKKT